jgi:hypothetical protein
MFDYLIKIYETEKYKRQQDPEGYDAATLIYRIKGPKSFYGLDRESLANYTTAMAIRIILKHPTISPSNTINIALTDNESMNIDRNLGVMGHQYSIGLGTYYWTSLVLIGMTLPDHKFDHNSIIINGYSARNGFKNQLGFFARFGSNSLYEANDQRFQKRLCNEIIMDILIDSSHESRAVQQAQEAAAARTREKEQGITRAQRIKTLCWLASNGNLREIITNDYTTEEINMITRDAFWGDPPSYLGQYNALMIAVAYRKLNVIKYFLEEKCADLSLKGGRNTDCTILDCAKQKWWFGPSVDLDIINYLNYCYRNESQQELFLKREKEKGILYGERAETHIANNPPRKKAWADMLAEKESVRAYQARLDQDRRDRVARIRKIQYEPVLFRPSYEKERKAREATWGRPPEWGDPPVV